MKRNLVTATILLGAWMVADAAGPVWVSSLNLSNATAGWGTVRPDKGISGGPISIAGKRFDRGFGTHAPGKLRIQLGGGAERFRAVVGVNDSAKESGSVEFIVSGDNRELWRSGVLRAGQQGKPVDLDLSGVQILTLGVTDAGDGTRHDHASWADARIEVREGGAPPQSIDPFETVRVRANRFVLEFRIGDDRRLYQSPIGGGNVKLKRADEAYPQAGDGYVFEPALQVTHADGNTSTCLNYESTSRSRDATGRELVTILLRDPKYAFTTKLFFRADSSRNVIEQWSEIQHSEPGIVRLERFASSSLLLSPAGLHLLQFHGDWADEMNPVVEPVTPGTKVLDSKLGVRAHRFRAPSFILALDAEPQEESGRVLAGSLAWSGSFSCALDHNGGSVRAICGMNPYASAFHLEPGRTFTTPPMIWAWSEKGMGDVSRTLHSWAREFAVRDGNKPRQVLLNNWEATGFDFNFDRIAGLYEPARQLGVELFLLDDGWFANKYPRVNDKAGLGDWEPNRKRLPNGIAPLAKAATDQNLRFGIWIEPEMVNPKSELYEQHPEWVIRQPGRELELQRNQLVLDMTRPEVLEFEWNLIQNVFSVPGVSYVKWDCNRYLTQPGSSWLAPGRQSHLWIEYVRSLYDLLERTVKAYPETELMLCSGGGGRVDFGALKYFHEFWPSDNTDPVRRVLMQWDYSYFFPAMTLSSHVTHWGKRPMHFACCVAMSARYGMDLDLAKLSADDKQVCSDAISAYKRIREVTHLGELYRLEKPHNAARGALNYVSADRSRAVLFVFQLKDGSAVAVRPMGLDPKRRYSIREANPAPGRDPLPRQGEVFTGEQLMKEGVAPACAKALEACVIEITGE